MNIIVAIDEQGAIGRKGDLLCHLPADLKHFKALTTGHTVVMGSRTYMSLPRRPLPNRRNIVLTHQDGALFDGAEVVHTLEEIKSLGSEIFIIGGGQVYEQLMPYATHLHITLIHHTFADADTFFPSISPDEWQEIARESFPADDNHPYPFDFIEYIRLS